ncbi:Spastin [Tetrabaena socialis]|uniref:microtubule-severing ATPase n=1 Tax=Tetrabaena socialis TaxID=47790 RepID=A0A2J8AER1_9CHLO|nr:Spastin [Tetrabaena socialis]|eukprot:PNH11007.1 Spastin [Tetrabaena socialis]
MFLEAQHISAVTRHLGAALTKVVTPARDDALGTVSPPRWAAAPPYPAGELLTIASGCWATLGLVLLVGLARVLGPRAQARLTPFRPPAGRKGREAPHPPHAVHPLQLRYYQLLLTMKSISALFGSFSTGVGGNGSQAAAKQQQQLKNREKLQSYHQLAKEAFERAYAADSSGRYDAAARLYRTGLEAAHEGLSLQVPPTSGLGPMADSVTGWRADMEGWMRNVTARLRALESGAASTSAPVRPTPQAAAAVAAQRRTAAPGPIMTAAGSRSGAYRAPQASPTSAAAPASAPGRGGGGGGEDGLQKFRDIVAHEILDQAPSVKWDDIAGLVLAKQALTEAVILPALRPDLFQGLRAPVRGILLYGPPGNGKTMLAKALAAEARATFFNISASSLTSKWVGEGEKMVRALFETAAARQPAIIFMDEVDSLLSSRGKAGESEATRRLLTEFLVQFDGVGGSGRERVVVVGATNRPQELDDAVRRRFTKRIYVPLPDASGRMAVLVHLLKGQAHRLNRADLDIIVRATAGYSASDLAALCKEAAMAPLRELAPSRLASVPANELRPIGGRDFAAALEVVRPSVNAATLRAFEDFTREYGTQ